ncbi:MAG: right-handed parallel beta-helix repeat-containing protein, partial [Candidatus Heimdallarchaeota archaeon]|nr:right-handed parallel beta-helix repeat-containing protein [Candidatus Heimdallarchaeota archaeon]
VGMVLQSSDDIIIEGNNLTINGYSGLFFENSSNNFVLNNNINGNGDTASSALSTMSLDLYQLITFAGFASSGFFMDPSTNNTVSGNDLSDNSGDGLALEFSSNNTITGNTADSNGFTGVFFMNSDDNDIIGNEFSSNGATALQLETAGLSLFELRLFAGFASSGFFMDPSFGNHVADNVIRNNFGNGLTLLSSDKTEILNNTVSSNAVDGISLINSSFNDVSANRIGRNGIGAAANPGAPGLSLDSMRLYAGFASSGFFMDPSEDNTFVGNNVTDNDDLGVFLLQTNTSIIANNTIDTSGGNGIKFIDSSFNNVTGNSISGNGFNPFVPPEEEEGLSLMAGFASSGFFMDPSDDNLIVGNNFTGNGDYGFVSQASTNTNFEGNRVLNHTLYGFILDGLTKNSSFKGNNFENNNNNGIQASDSGSGNKFEKNFWSDHDNTDADFDGEADTPYKLDGLAKSIDDKASNIRNGLNFHEPLVHVGPQNINVGDLDEDRIKVWANLSDGFRALAFDLTKVKLNGSLTPTRGFLYDKQSFLFLFNRQLVSQMIIDLFEEREEEITSKSRVVLELTGRVNDDLLDLRGSDEIKLSRSQNEKTNPRQFILIIGGIGIIPTAFRRRKNKQKKLLSHDL